MIYYPLHMPEESGHKSIIKVPPVFFFTASAEVAVKVGMVLLCLTLLLSVLLPLAAPLGLLYLGLVAAAGLYTLIGGWKYMNDPLNRKKGIVAFKIVTLFRLVISIAIVLSVLLVSS
jgi:hypothetical protein